MLRYPGLGILLLKAALVFGNGSREDTTRIHACRYNFNLTASLTKPIFSTAIWNSDDNLRLKYRTINPVRIGLAFDYRWFGVEVSSQVPTFKSQDVRKGKTSSSSYRFTINSRKFSVLTQYQDYHGFYLSDNKVFYNPFSVDDPLPKRPDLVNIMIHLNTYYYFNHTRYSHPAAAGQFERQLKSGGSPTVGVGYLFNSLQADSSLIPGNFRNNFPNMGQMKKVSSSHLYFSLGYNYTFIFLKKFFLNLSANPGAARFQLEETRFDGSTTGRWDLGLRFETRNSLGYNGESFYYGVYYSGFWTNERLVSGNSLVHTFQTFRFFTGWRFKTHKSLGFLGL